MQLKETVHPPSTIHHPPNKQQHYQFQQWPKQHLRKSKKKPKINGYHFSCRKRKSDGFPKGK
jgi:hypothetical protein